MLQKDPSKRLGSGPNGIEEIKCHRWFKPVNWHKLDKREIQPSFKPVVYGKECVANFSEEWTNMPLIDSPASTPKSREKKDNLFENFNYCRPQIIVS